MERLIAQVDFLLELLERGVIALEKIAEDTERREESIASVKERGENK